MADILRYWQAVELFEPRGIPGPTGRTSPGKERVQVFRLGNGKPVPALPWEPAHPRFAERAERGRFGRWRHTVYGGVFSFSAVRAELRRVLGYTEAEDYAGSKRDVVSATFAFTVDQGGRLMEQTMALSSCAWATGRLREPGPSAPGWLDGFEGDTASSSYDVRMLLSEPVEYLPPPPPGQRPAGPQTAAQASADQAGDASGGGHANEPAVGWRVAVTETLGTAAAAAVGALIGTVTPEVGGPVAAAALSSATKSVMDSATRSVMGRLTKREGQAAAAHPAAPPRAPGHATGSREPEQAESGARPQGKGLASYGIMPDDARAWERGRYQLTPGSLEHSYLRPMRVFDIVAFAAYAADRLRLPEGLADHLELRIVSKPVHGDLDRERESVLLRSMFATDIKRVADSANTGVGAALASYLSDPVPAAGRVDVRTENGRQRVLEGLHPAAFPPARWPSAADKRLVAGQQFAVNEIMAALDGVHGASGHDAAGGLFAVNGPPGTGKTTLLRDLVAAVVVRRAEVLATLEKPQDGFTTKDRPWRRGDGANRQIWIPRADLTGYEIVVASSNNAAVENITKELPACSAIGAEWQADYFAEQATAVLGGPAWGLLAAALGNGANRAAFRANFWFGHSGGQDDDDRSGDAGKASGGGAGAEVNTDDADGIGAMRTHLRAVKDGLRPGQWQEAVDRFNAALGVARKLADERGQVADALLPPASPGTVRLARQAADAAQKELDSATADRERADALVAATEEAAAAIGVRLRAHAQERPGGIRCVLAFGRPVSDWRRRGAELQGQLDEASRELSAAQAEARRARDAVLAVVPIAANAASSAASLEAGLRGHRARVQRARDEWGEAFPEGWLGQAEDAQERSSPWSDDEWNAARTEVFLAALDLHRAFVEGNAGAFLQNLRMLVGSFGRDFRGPEADDKLPAWQTFFLLIPVVSTTFASFAGMFYGLGRESLGWLLVDEAGQAVPQAAVGALWRARRAVIVGDPRQLEPISQVPVAVQERLRVASGLAEHWLPGGTSVQGIADRRSVLGTDVSTGGDSVWVGTPLRVHRRCEHPMFEMSNHLAYGGLMVYDTREQRFPADGMAECGPSRWIDVPGHGDDGSKWVADQGRALVWVLRNLLSARFGVKLADIYVVSPFRDVARGCQTYVKTSMSDDSQGGAGLDAFIRSHIGTVHTMQGKEADVVVLVLGADKSHSRKARDWVGDPPNLLNVAVSRARRRLFVIGGYDEWASAPNFGVFAARKGFTRQQYH